MFKETNDKTKGFDGELEIRKMVADLKKESNRHSRTEEKNTVTKNKVAELKFEPRRFNFRGHNLSSYSKLG